VTLLGTVVAMVAVVAGALIQGTIGFGFAFVAVPTLTLLRPDALPAALLLLAFPMTVAMAVREWSAIDLRGFAYATAGRVVGTAGGIALLSAIPRDSLSVLVGVFVLVAVGLSAAAPEFEMRRSTVLAAGVAAGVMGTAAAIGGPPMALAYQNRPGDELRSTLAISFVVGGAMSLTGLAFAGRLEGWHALLALRLLPALAVGLVASRYIVRWVDGRWLRPAVLAFAALAGAAAIVRGVLG
jgi:uncharacterized membrane protein YfcA